jgi:3-oxoacyl-[acyl-carrier-protein] synthase-1
MTQPVHIVAVGAYTPVGLAAEAAAVAARAGVSRVREHPFMLHPGSGEPLYCAMVPAIEPAVSSHGRFVALAQGVLVEIAEKLCASGPCPVDVPVVLAIPEPRPGFQDGDAVRLGRAVASLVLPGIRELRARRVGLGHAGVFQALALATDAIAAGKTELCVVAGVDSYLDADAIDWLYATRRLKGEEVRNGFTPGEAAGAVCLAGDGVRARLGLPSLARIRAVATAEEPRLADSEEGLLGEGLSAVLASIGARLRLPEESVDSIYCDINGERSRTEEWGFAALRAPGVLSDPSRYVSAIGTWGDVGAATGALSCVLAVQAFQRGYAPGPRALAWGSSWAGLRGAAVLEEGVA